MILRIVYSFFFINLVTGDQRVNITAGLPHATLLKTTSPQVLQNTQPPLKVVEGHYGYPANPVHSVNPQSRIKTTSSDVEYVSDESPQVPRSVQYVEDETKYTERTICFTPSMVHKMIKAALDYVSQMPSDINNIVEKLNQELNIMSDSEIEENAVKKPLYPLDSKTIFQMLDKPRSEEKMNLIFKYEVPGVKPPLCREALEKLIEIAYTAYLELEKHPQCREYLYNFAAHQPEDHPKGHLNQGPDLKSLITSILDEVDKRKPNLDISPQNDRNGDAPIFADIPTPQHNIPHVQEYNIPQKPQTLGYNIPQQPQTLGFNIPQQPQTLEYKFTQQPQTLEYNIPQQPETLGFNIPQQPQTLEYNIPQQPQTLEYKFTQQPQTLEYNIPQQPETLGFNIPQQPQTLEYNIPQQPQTLGFNIPQQPQTLGFNIPQQPQTLEYNIPQPPQTLEYNIPRQPQTLEYNIPQQPQMHIQKEILTYSVPEAPEYNVPQFQELNINEYSVPQMQDIISPQVQSIEMPEIHETIHETVEEIIPMQPEETINILIKLLANNDQIDNGNLFDRLMNIIKENQNIFHPRIFKLLLTLLNTHKQNNIPNFNDLFLLLLDSQRNGDWPWSERVTEHLLSYLIPDQNSYLDSGIVEIILNLFKKRPNEQHIEYILSLLRPFKEGNMDTIIGDLILKLIHLNQHNLMRPDHVDILLKLLKLSQEGHINPLDLEIITNLSKWNEIGLSPNQLNGLIALLKPYINGHPDRRPVYITHFLLTKGRNLNPKQLDFILSFLYPENGVLNARRIDLINFLLNNLSQYPNPINILLTLLQENGPGVLNSRFLEILLFLNSRSLLTQELVETVINLLVNEVTGQLEDHHVKNLFFQLAPHKQSNPELVVDVLNLLNQGGLHRFEITNNNIFSPNTDSKPNNVKLLELQPENKNEYRTPDGAYQTVETPQDPDHDFMSIFKWLDSQGVITQDQGSNTDLVNKILKILEVGQREPGVVELTYMLKHEKPRIYQPVYYVKYRLPILSFISNTKNLLLENPNLNADPMKLLQELTVISNVTEVSPNLQGYPKEEILKLTFNDGDLVQAKILDEQNLSLNEQITYVQGLNSDISPEEILQLNQMNEAKYFPKLIEVKGKHPETLTIKDIDKFIEVPPVHYRHHLELSVVSPKPSSN